jgi:hypothetical protein
MPSARYQSRIRANLVLEQLAERVFEPNRLTDLLESYLDGSAQAEHDRRQRQGRLKAELTETEGAIQKLLDMVEKGLMDVDDPALAERLQRHKLNRTKLTQEIALANQPITGPLTITPKKLERLSGQMREALMSGPIEFRRAYLRMFVQRVVVSPREVRISGPKSTLAKTASADLPAPGPEVLVARASAPCQLGEEISRHRVREVKVLEDRYKRLCATLAQQQVDDCLICLLPTIERVNSPKRIPVI